MTIKTQAQLLAQFKDNTTGEITAQDVRDLVDTFFQPRTRRLQLDVIARATGGGRPTPGSIGPTGYASYGVGDYDNPHVTLPDGLDATQDILVHVDFFPLASEASRTVSFDLQYLPFADDGAATLDVAAGTLQAVNVAVPATQYVADSFTFTVPASAIADTDHEIHFELRRVASSNDPAAIAVHHLWAEVVTKPPGAS